MIDILAPGTEVYWKRNGRTVATRVRSAPVIVERVNGPTVLCVALECNRFVPAGELELTAGENDVTVQGVPRKGSVRMGSSGRRDSLRATKTRDVEHAVGIRDGDSDLPSGSVSSADRVRPAENSRPVSAERPEADPQIRRCGVLAIDFMNLLVRAFHAGKPTDVHAVVSMLRTVCRAIDTLQPERVVFALDGGHAHRSELLPEYKAHRDPPEPLLVQQRELAEQALEVLGIPAVRVQGFEADDVLASIVRSHDAVIVCSSDKDLLSLDGRARIYHPWAGGKFETAENKLGLPPSQVSDFLALCGDSSDGVPGVKGVGPKTALALLQEHESLEAILAAAKLGRIKGAICRKIADQSSEALLCRKVVDLRDTLPVPELQPVHPRSGWQQRLQALGLRSVISTIENTLSGQSAAPREALSASTGKDELGRPSGEAAGNPESPAGTVTRSIGQPIRSGLSVEQLWETRESGLIGCWERGRQAAFVEQNPWRPGTENHTAWAQGFAQQDLCIECSAAVMPLRPDPEERPKTNPVRTLF